MWCRGGLVIGRRIIGEMELTVANESWINGRVRMTASLEDARS